MTKLLGSIALVGIIFSPAWVVAQETVTTDTTEEISAEAVEEAAPVLELGQLYAASTHGDWTVECVRTATPVNDPCEMTQILKGTEDNNVAKISVSTLTGDQEGAPPAGACITAPLMTLLPSGIGWSIDDGPTRTHAFFACNQTGCITEFGLSDEEINIMKKGAKGKVSLRPAAAPNQVVEAELSLSGFTAAYDSLSGN